MLVPREVRFLHELADLFQRFGARVDGSSGHSLLVDFYYPRRKLGVNALERVTFLDSDHCLAQLNLLSDLASGSSRKSYAVGMAFLGELRRILGATGATICPGSWDGDEGNLERGVTIFGLEGDIHGSDEILCYHVVEPVILMRDATSFLEDRRRIHEIVAGKE